MSSPERCRPPGWRGRAPQCREPPTRGLARTGTLAFVATLLFTGDDEIRALNREFRGLDRATDVLSFHMQELKSESDPAGDGVFLGDIVISVDTPAATPAAPASTGNLNVWPSWAVPLVWHDHHRPGQARRMRALERQLLAATA